MTSSSFKECETNIHICESTAYRRLMKYGLCDRGIVPQFYGTMERMDLFQYQPHLKMFLNDKNPPSAIFLGNIPRMEMIHPHYFTKELGEALTCGIREIHRALVLHCDVKSRNVMIVRNDPERVIWVNFDRAQTYHADSLTERQQGCIEDEELMVSQLADSLEADLMFLVDGLPSDERITTSKAHLQLQPCCFINLSRSPSPVAWISVEIIFQETQISGQGDAGVQKITFRINQPSKATQQENELAFSVQSAHEPSPFDMNGKEPYDNRILCCLAHPSLYPDGNILHQDISEKNIIITDPEKADGHSGMLIDLDLAKEFGSERSGAQHQTGMMEFMAIEVLLNVDHTYHHDLELFFYVPIWQCAHHGWENSMLKKSYSSTIATYKRGNMKAGGFEYLFSGVSTGIRVHQASLQDYQAGRGMLRRLELRAGRQGILKSAILKGFQMACGNARRTGFKG
ncbi:uncharacterized protein PADG_06738 [Paracoccidioides brasiliensis Pb18]|uniref:Fungal-type protein kinase domain-containing protein n=1 Tax=Paracoccidioides brasiliensis (strain Pb18) TaxID=502780 RepID=C1GHK2_PARBD|nr:uncharacterized protein PADG_06738 [Paracoccidioides brasiliensis Pb18]EEH50659.2 hypothetical protein PADG_06738 [Paracoccidioides brasiliensis Pb18]